MRLQQALSKVDWPALGLAGGDGSPNRGSHRSRLSRFRRRQGQNDLYGTHVNRTARLEPIVQPRAHLVTEEFAASLVAEDQDRFLCDYIGTMKLTPKFGDARLYRAANSGSRCRRVRQTCIESRILRERKP